MTNKNQVHLQPLSEDQIQELARFINEEFGVDLSQDELDESIGVAMEKIPGLELESTQQIHRLVKSIRRKYHDEIHYHRNQD